MFRNQRRQSALQSIRAYRYVASFALDLESASWTVSAVPPSHLKGVVVSPQVPYQVCNSLGAMDIRRHLMGLFGIVFLISGTGLLFLKGANDSQWSMFASICIRVGLMLGAIWLAFPQVVGLAKKFPPWLMVAIVTAGLVVAARPRMILYLGPVVAAIAVLQFVGWLFKPLPQSKSKRPDNTTSTKNTDK